MKTLTGILILISQFIVFRPLANAQSYQPYWDAPAYVMSPEDSTFLEELQRDTFNWFWEKAHSTTGLTPDRSTDFSTDNYFISVAAVGFGLTAYGIGSERGYVTREQAATRVEKALSSLLSGKMGIEKQGTIGYRGWFYHFLDARTLTRSQAWQIELSSIDTGLLLMGVIFVRNYFDADSPLETTIRAEADSILDAVLWSFMLNPNNKGVSAGWFPESGYIDWEYRGYNEALFLYILGLGAEKNPLPTSSWTFWVLGYELGNTPYFNQHFIRFAPLFGHQYPHSWIDFRGLTNKELKNSIFGSGYDYFENGRRATYANRAYCAANPKSWPNYDENEWGLTACDGPPGLGYLARGASSNIAIDDGTIAPTAAGGSIAYAPEIVFPALRSMKDAHGSKLYANYGFRDAYNIQHNWFDSDYIGIDQGPILLMVENFRSELVWRTMRRDPIIQRGLQRAGFTGGWLDSLAVGVEDHPQTIDGFVLQQNYPNPFNASTRIAFELKQRSHVRLEVFDVLGQRVVTLIDEVRDAEEHFVIFDAHQRTSGIYWYRLQSGQDVQIKKMLYLK